MSRSERLLVRSYQGGKRWLVICPRCGPIVVDPWGFGMRPATRWRAALREADYHAAWHRSTDGALQHLLRRVHPNVGWAL